MRVILGVLLMYAAMYGMQSPESAGVCVRPYRRITILFDGVPVRVYQAPESVQYSVGDTDSSTTSDGTPYWSSGSESSSQDRDARSYAQYRAEHQE